MINLRQAIEKRTEAYDRAIAECSTLNSATYLLREKKRFLCKNDLFYLCVLVGNSEIAKYPEFYKPFCDEVILMNWAIVSKGAQPKDPEMLDISDVTDDASDLEAIQRMYLCHRSFYKTTIITKVHSLQLLLCFPNIHICLAHNKQENSSDNLVTIKNYFLTTEIKTLFRDFIPEGKDWGNMAGFSVAKRTDWHRSEENIEAIGVDTEVTGRHWQVAKKNDLVTEKSVWTEDQIKKTADWDTRFNLGNFDNPQLPFQDYEGTRYHFADLYSVKLNDKRIKLIEYPLLKDKNPDNLTEENIQNSKRFTAEGIMGLKTDMWIFMTQHMLKPEDPAKMQFKKEMIQYFNEIPENLNYYLFVDPASTRKKRSDFTAMIVVGVDYDGNRYIVDGVRDRLDPKQRIDLAFDLAVKWVVKEIGWEALGFQTTDCYYLEEKRRGEKKFFTITEIKSQVVAKEDRIRSLVPEYASHKWHWPAKGKVVNLSLFDGKSYDLTENMEYELTQFPLCEHDDILDVQTFLNRISIIKPQRTVTAESGGMTFGEYAKQKEERLARLNADPWARAYAGN